MAWATQRCTHSGLIQVGARAVGETFVLTSGASQRQARRRGTDQGADQKDSSSGAENNIGLPSPLLLAPETKRPSPARQARATFTGGARDRSRVEALLQTSGCCLAARAGRRFAPPERRWPLRRAGSIG